MTLSTAGSQRLRQANESDVEAISKLVNLAFEVENFFKNDDRTDPIQIRQMMSEGIFFLLLIEAGLVASIYVKLNGERAYIGLLAVDPDRQKSGLGKRMMSEAESYARDAGCKYADIRVVNLRAELVPLYRKLGFIETGTENIAADLTQKFTQPVHFVCMSKAL